MRNSNHVVVQNIILFLIPVFLAVQVTGSCFSQTPSHRMLKPPLLDALDAPWVDVSSEIIQTQFEHTKKNLLY